MDPILSLTLPSQPSSGNWESFSSTDPNIVEEFPSTGQECLTWQGHQFLVHRQLAQLTQLAVDANGAHAKVKKARFPTLVLSRATYTQLPNAPGEVWRGW